MPATAGRGRRWLAQLPAVAGVLCLPACAAGAAAPAGGVQFVDVAAEAGLELVNVSGDVAKRHIIESTGAGACFLDHDLDGDLDLYIVNGSVGSVGSVGSAGATLAAPPTANAELSGAASPARDALYQNDGHGRFLDVTAAAGLGDRRWGGGCAVGDIDNDGDPDLFVTNQGPDVLYRNQGDGTFRDVTAAAGVGDARWGIGAVFFDAEGDGDLDLYVANYLFFDLASQKVLAERCRWKGADVMCGPRGFPGEPDVLYLNRGDGTFLVAPAASGVGGDRLYGMGVVAGDVDGDGDTDLLVANDSQENLLLVNDGQGRFEDQGLAAGIALSGDGRQQAGMGIDLGDYDSDGDDDLFVTNFSDDYHTLYRNEGELLFTDVSAQAGLDRATRSSLGWGGGFLDFDNDADLDLFVAGGHVYPEVDAVDPATSYRQRNLLLANGGAGRFSEVGAASGPGFATPRLGRGAAFGDVDDDGDLDIAVVNDGEPPALLRNDGGNARHWLKVRLIGRRGNRDGLGARLRLVAGGRAQSREARFAGGYASSHDPRLHFGLGAATCVDRLEIRWPAGTVQTFAAMGADQWLTIDEVSGVVAAGSATAGPTPPALVSRAQPVGAAGCGAGAESAAAPPSVAQLRSGAASAAPVEISPPAVLDAAALGDAAAPGDAVAPARAVAGRLTHADLRRVDELVTSALRRILGGQPAEGAAAYREALAVLPPWPEASRSPDALGFGDRERYRAFLAGLYDNLGVALMRAERLGECAAAIKTALQMAPERAKFHHNLGLCHFHGGRYPEAIAALEDAARAGGSPGLRYDLGRALAEAGRCDEAINNLTQGLDELPRPDLRGRDAEAWYYRGECLAGSGRHAEAADAMREALALMPGHQKALYRLVTAWRRAGETAAAQAAEELFTRRQAADETLRAGMRAGARERAVRLALARSFLDAGLAHKAVQEAQELLAADGRDVAGGVVLGTALLALRPPVRGTARATFERVLELQPGEAAAIRGLARTETGPTAVSRLEAVLKQAPEDRALAVALAEQLVASTDGGADAARRALRLLGEGAALYGEGEATRVRALAILGDRAGAQHLLETSPFLGRADRVALAAAIGKQLTN